MFKHVPAWFSGSIGSRLCAPRSIADIIDLDPVLPDGVGALQGASVSDLSVRRSAVAVC